MEKRLTKQHRTEDTGNDKHKNETRPDKIRQNKTNQQSQTKDKTEHNQEIEQRNTNEKPNTTHSMIKRKP